MRRFTRQMFAKDCSENDRFLHLVDSKLIMNTQKQLTKCFSAERMAKRYI